MASPPTWRAAAENAAQFLINEGLCLTALEMYQELLEAGKEVPSLRRYIESQLQGETLSDLSRVGKKGVDTNSVASSSSGEGEVNEEVRRLHAEVHRLTMENTKLLRRLEAVQHDSLPPAGAGNGPAGGSSTGGMGKEERKDRLLEREVVLLSEKVKALESKERSAVHIIADRLPTVVNSVRSSSKDCLTQILLTVIESHSDSQVRSSLLYYYVTLFKRPTAEERGNITEGLGFLAQRLARTDPLRTEVEIVPAVRSLADMRYPEQRVLAISALQVLLRHVRPAVQHEILAGCLGGLVTDPHSSVVREAAVLAISESIPPSAPTGLVSELSRSMVSALKDSSTRVQRAALQHAVPSVSSMAAKSRCLCTAVLDPLVDALLASDPLHLPMISTALSHALSVLRALILETTPSTIGAPSDGIEVLLARAISRRIKGVWPDAEWVIGPFVNVLLDALGRSEDVRGAEGRHSVDHRSEEAPTLAEAITDSLVSAVRGVAVVLGEEVVRPGLEDLILGTAGKALWHLLPLYVRYSLRLSPLSASSPSQGSSADGEREGDSTHLPSFLLRAIQHCSHEDDLDPFGTALSAAVVEFPEVQAMVVDVLWDCVADEQVCLKIAAGRCLSILLLDRCFNPRLLTRRILPALHAMAIDANDTVCQASVRPAAYLATQVESTDVLAKLGNILSLSVKAGDLDSYRRAVQAWSGLVPRMPAAFIESSILPQLSAATTLAAEVQQHRPHRPPALPQLVPLLCEASRAAAGCLSSLGDLTPFSTLCTAMKGLGKALQDPLLKSMVTATVKEMDAALKTAAEERPSEGGQTARRVLAKFRDLLPATPTPSQTVPPPQPAPPPTPPASLVHPLPIATSGSSNSLDAAGALQASAPSKSPKGDDDESTAKPTKTAPPKSRAPSILTKMQRLFGSDHTQHGEGAR